MSASRFEPEGLSIIDAGQAPEIFATGMERADSGRSRLPSLVSGQA